MTNFSVPDNTILVGVMGSRVAGLHTPTSDVDLMGVCIPPAEARNALDYNFDQVESKGMDSTIGAFAHDLYAPVYEAADKNGIEGTIYNLKKYMSLAAKCNPTILQLLFSRDEEIIFCEWHGEKLREIRDSFLSIKAHKAYTGYAISQLKRMRGHKEWLDNPPAKPDRKAAGLPLDNRLLNKEQLKAFSTIGWGKMKSIGISNKLIELIQAEVVYMKARDKYKRYETWVKNRNPDRAALEAKAGYDCKHAMHLVRLLVMGKEIVQDGEVNVWRGDRDADLLIDIRNGAWSYEKLIDWSENTRKEIDSIVKSGNSVLPDEPDWDTIKATYYNLVQAWG